MKLANDTAAAAYTSKTSSGINSSRLRFIPLPPQEDGVQLFHYIESLKDPIRETVSNLMSQTSSQITALVLDMFCTSFIDVAAEFSLPSFVFFTSGACCLGLFFHLLSLKFDHGQQLSQFKNVDTELTVSCFSNPVPAKVLPAILLEESPIATIIINCFRRMGEAQGILVNTFYELESFAIDAMATEARIPRVYPIGPILNLNSAKGSPHGHAKEGVSQSPDEILEWLGKQPENSVIFLCFGSMGSFPEAQVREIAAALERSGSRFLWSLRKPPQIGKGLTPFPTEYDDFEEVLPEGFLNRTEGIGKVIGWAPQVAVLGHPAVGGFVSHCGWNSTLESIWFGVPVATFPLSAEQQLNAFQLVKELQMAEAISIEYNSGMREGSPSAIVGAQEIETAIRRLMVDGGVREKVKEMQRKSRLALEEGGSSYNTLNQFIIDVGIDHTGA